MAARRSNQPPQDISLFVVVAGALGAGVAAWYGWPGIPVVWLSVLAASWMVQSPQLTGKKDSAGYPAPANPAEERKVSRYQASKELRTSLLFPLRDLLPGKPVRAAWISAVIVAWIAYLVPVIGNHHMASGNATALDALATLWLTLATTGAFRRAKGVDNPGVRVDTWRTYRAGHRLAFVAIIAVLGAISGVVFAVALISLDARFGRGFGTATLAPRGARHPGLFIADPDIAIATLAGAGAWFAVLVSWRRTAISEYSDLVNARAQWKYRWMSLKYDPTPTVVKHEVRDGVVIDTLDAPAHLGAIEFLRNEQKLAPLMGPGERVALISVPEDGPLGPVPGTRSATRFLTATWSSSYDITGTGADVELVTLWAQSVLAWVGRSVGVPLEPMPNEVVSVTSFVDESPDVTTALDAKTGTGMIDRVSRFWQAVREPAPTTSTLDVAASREDSGSVDTDDGDVAGSAHPQSLLWRTTWYYSDDTIGPQVFRDAHLAALESAMRAGVLIDHRDGGTMFLGDAGAAQDDENTERALTKVRTEDLWRQVWTSSVKMGANLPVPQIATHAERPLASGATVHRMAFALNLGNSPLDYKYAGVENKLKSALGMGRTSGASFVAVTGFPDSRNGGRPGDRHPQAIYVIWSFDAVPRTPTAIAPSSPADVWMLAGIINDAFTNVKLEHPEIVSARCLTKPHSRSHAWEIQLRLYGGVTTGMVRSAAGKIADNLATPWVRVADADDGCVLYVGEAPDDANFAQRGDAALVAALDWEQAFLVSHVVGSVGSVPRLVSSNEMPSNSNVKVLEFELPPGLDKASLKAATGKLRTATGNAYISVLDSPKGPTFVTIQASRENPLPNTVPFDFAAADRADGMAFATGVDGEPVEFIPKIDVHAAIIGMSGSGKSVTAQALLYGAAIKGSEIYVIDPSKGAADFKFLAPFARVMATTIHAAAATLKAIYAEVERRKDLNAHYGTASITDLPDDVRPSPMFVFIDEFTSLITSEKVPRQPFDDPELEAERQTQLRISNDRMAIAYYTGKLAREARSAGVSLSLGTQKLMADSLKAVPGAADLKTNLSRILLGSTSQGERMSALRAFDQAPDPGETVPIGRGIWESSTKTGVLIQAWYAPASQLGEELAERVEPLDASQRLDITPFLSREIEQFGAFEPDGADRVIDLGEISFTLDDLESVDRPEVVDEVEDEVPDPWRIDWGVPPQVAVAAAADLDDDPFALPPPKPKRELALKPDDDPFA